MLCNKSNLFLVLPQLQILTQIPIMNHDCHMCMKWAPFLSAFPQLLEVLTSGFSSNLIAELESGFSLGELFFEILVLFVYRRRPHPSTQ